MTVILIQKNSLRLFFLIREFRQGPGRIGIHSVSFLYLLFVMILNL